MNHGDGVGQTFDESAEPGPVVPVDLPHYLGKFPTVSQGELRTVVGQFNSLPAPTLPLPLACPPVVNGKGEIHEDDGVRGRQTTLDGIVAPKSVDDPRGGSRQAVQLSVTRRRRRSFPTGPILNAVYMMDREPERIAEQP